MQFRVTQVVAEVLVEAPGTAKVQVTQVVAEVLVEAAGTAVVRATQVAVEVLVEEDWPNTLRETAPRALTGATGTIAAALIFGALSETAPSDTDQVDGQVLFPGVWETAPPALESAIGTVLFSGLLETAPVATEIGSGLTYANVPAVPGVTQALVEVAIHGEQGFAPPALAVTQDVVEWAHAPHPTLVVTQDVIEWALHPANHLIVTQACIEVAYKGQRRPRVIARYQRAIPAYPSG